MSHLLHPFAADGNVVVMTARRSRKLLMMVILLEFTNGELTPAGEISPCLGHIFKPFLLSSHEVLKMSVCQGK